MPEFFNVLPPDQARDLLLEHTRSDIPFETVQTDQALQRVTADAVSAPHNLPSFARSTMDGYAVRASDTHGASQNLPAILTVVDEVQMGAEALVVLEVGQAALIHTGGMIPNDADAVVQVENTQTVGTTDATGKVFEIEVFRPVAVGQNVLQVGEDVKVGSQVIPAGHLIRAQDIGGLLALGITDIHVARRPGVAIIATGDEIVQPSEAPVMGQIRDINSYTIASLVRQNGGIPHQVGVVADEFDSLVQAASVAIRDSDMLVISAGSSVSVRDMTVRVIEELGEPGVLLHGVATRPGKPTVIGALDGKPILGLPGNPVSAMVQFIILGLPALYKLQGMKRPPRRGLVWARVSQNIPSESGREDYLPVILKESDDGFVAEPVFGKSNLIYTLVNADGLMKIPMNKSGLQIGEWVEVGLF